MCQRSKLQIRQRHCPVVLPHGPEAWRTSLAEVNPVSRLQKHWISASARVRRLGSDSLAAIYFAESRASPRVGRPNTRGSSPCVECGAAVLQAGEVLWKKTLELHVAALHRRSVENERAARPCSCPLCAEIVPATASPQIGVPSIRSWIRFRFAL
jgi:hypothetical protein